MRPNVSYTYKKNRAILKARTQQIGAPCSVCGKAFRWDVIWYHPLAFTSGHILAVVDGGTDEMENLRPEHHACNVSAGGRLGASRSSASIPGTPSNRRPVPTPLPDPKSQEWP